MKIAGREFRVESNWNALTAFLCAVGRDTMDDLSHIESIKASELIHLMHACISEGERLEGREFSMTALDLGAIITPDDMKVFLDIYVDHSNPRVALEDEPKKEEREESPAS